ncbi:MAG TPA: tetratricopeptide repeat protein [Polyangia bacterium]|nr:tetratricopeptide repeat protein [Polyangia bacterium]
MRACGRIERQLLDVVRGAASDAVRLEVEEHLEECASCREVRASLGLLGALRAQPAPRLGASAERRIVERLVATGGPRARAALAPRRPGRVMLVGLAVAALGALVFVAAPRGWRRAPAPVAEGLTLEATQAGVIAFEGAGVMYGRGTSLTFHAATRTIAMTHGQVDVDVTEHRARHFRVTTPRFVVEVLGTHFVVTPTGVRTLRGRVRVLDLEGREIAVVAAGESWTTAESAVAPPSPVASPARAPSPIAQTIAPTMAPSVSPPPLVTRPSVSRAVVAHPGVDVAALVAEARAALAAGDAARARTFIDRAVAAGPAPSERPVVDLLGADALLVERRPAEAVAAYRGVLRRHPDAPEAETASFAVGQLLFESGAQLEAAAALDDYAARYPHGRFVREARDLLAQIRPAE